MLNKKRKTTGKVTLSDVAKLANVGPMTVSRVLRQPNLVSENLQQRVHSAIKHLNYIPNQAASMLASAKNQQMIAIIHNPIFDYNALQFFSMIENELSKDYIVVKTLYMQSLKENNFLKHNFSLVILFDVKLNKKESSYLLNLPLVSIGYTGDCSINLGTIYSKAMYQLTRYTIKKGYTNIGLLCSNKEYPLFQQYLHGWHKAMIENHLSTHRVMNTSSKNDYLSGADAFSDFLLNWFDTDLLICTSDELACGVLFECQRKKLNIPHQIALAGFGNQDISQTSYPALTTVSIDFHKAKKVLINYFLDIIHCNVNASLDPSFFEKIDIIIQKRESL